MSNRKAKVLVKWGLVGIGLLLPLSIMIIIPFFIVQTSPRPSPEFYIFAKTLDEIEGSLVSIGWEPDEPQAGNYRLDQLVELTK